MAQALASTAPVRLWQRPLLQAEFDDVAFGIFYSEVYKAHLGALHQLREVEKDWATLGESLKVQEEKLLAANKALQKLGRQQGPDKRRAIARVKKAEESRERLKQLLATLRVVRAERAEELAVLDRQLALNAEMKEKEESLKQYSLEVVSECKNALMVQRELVASKEILLSKAKADAEEAGRSAASIEEQLSTAEAASMATDEHFQQVRSELGSLSSKSARRTR
eukprot:6209376-Pleurochrysis_carterae.AAC.1